MTATLLGLPDDDRPVLIVPSHADAAAVASIMPAYAVVWPSADDAQASVTIDDLLHLQGADVLLWPHGTENSRSGMCELGNRLLKVASRVRSLHINGEDPDGFRPSDAGAWSRDVMLSWCRSRVRAYEYTDVRSRVTQAERDAVMMPDPPMLRRGRPRHDSEPIDLPLQDPLQRWLATGIELASDHRGAAYAHLANVQTLLAGHPDLLGRIWFDEFRGRIMSDLWGEADEWCDHYDTRLTIWMQREMRLPKLTPFTVQRGVEEIAHTLSRNEPKEWLSSLKWDQTERLPTLMSDAFGAPQDDYTAAVGRCWLVSMAARVLTPGCKVDTMPVFEGPQGARKSTALRTLGGDYFAEAHEDILSKDFLQALRGKMLIEVSELHAFRRAEVDKIKGVVSCAVDRYRESYGRRSADHPRHCVFAGTTNRDNWVQDDTGARRFWPIACGDINIPYLERNRDQLFAEAVHRFQHGESWWDVPVDMAKEQQDMRRDEDVWAEVVLTYASTRDEVIISEIMETVLDIKRSDQGKADQMRIGSILRLAGWKNKQKRTASRNRQVWTRPEVPTVATQMSF